MIRFTLLVVATAVLATAVPFAVPAQAQTYSQTLDAAAHVIELAVKTHGPVPTVHVPPPPLPGPPRYSPSIDDWLQASLRSARRDPKHDLAPIAASLRFIAGDGASNLPLSQPATDVEAAARSVLANRAYDTVKTGPAPVEQPSLLERILNWIGEQLGKLFEGLSRMATAAPFLGQLFTVVIIALAVFALAAVGYRLARSVARRRRPEVDLGIPLERVAGVDELIASARQASASGDFAKAVSLLFVASLMLLDRKNKIPYDAARTAGEYRRLVRRRAAPIASPFDALARAFTLAAYADAPVGERDWAAAESSFNSLAPALGSE